MNYQHINKNVIYIPRTDSTNREMFRLIEKNPPPEGTIIWSEEQYSGKGLGKAVWESERGMNITASYLFYPEFIEPENQFDLNKAISLGVYDAIKSILQTNFHVWIKWPNDILVDDKKIAGILTENIIQGSEIKYTVAGVGINANQTEFSNFPRTPASLKLLTGTNYNIPECIDILFYNLENRYLMLKNGLKKQLNHDYLNKLYKYGKKANYRANDKTFTATIYGVDKYGKLLLENQDGKIEAYDFKEVELID